MMATSIPPSSSKSSSPPPVRPTRTPRSFHCTEELWRAFAARAAQLECSTDWLLGEAMKRLLESGPGREPREKTSATAGPPPPPTYGPNVPSKAAGASSSKAIVPSRTTLPPLPPPLPPPPYRNIQAREPRHQELPRGLTFVVKGARTLVDRDAFVIGRSAREAHLVLRDQGVSRQHAMVERTGAAYVIVDMASTNGVMVNGVRIARAVLRAGDRIEIGPFTIDVERGGPGA